MKQLLLLSITAWFSVATQSCQYKTSPETLVEKELRALTTSSTEQSVAVLAHGSSPDMDTLIRLTPTPVPFDADSSAHIMRIGQLRGLDETSIEPSEILVELPLFKGQNINETSALLFLVNQDTLKLYVDYFDGDLKGSKIFYIAAGNLLAVDIFVMEEQWTEGGVQLHSVLTHSFYYKDKKMFCCEAHKYPEQQVVLEEENQQDWQQVRHSLQIS